MTDPTEAQGWEAGGRRACCGRRHAGLGRGSFVEPVALAALLAGSAHGYDLRRAIQELTGGEIDVDTGGLYRVLRRFESEGFATSAWDEAGNGPARRHYDITEQGHDLARDWVAHLRERERLAKMMADLLESSLDEAVVSTAPQGGSL